VRDSAGDTVLMRAIRADREFVAMRLVELSDKHDWTAIDKTVLEGKPALMRQLWEHFPYNWRKRSHPHL
jgi:hypothetical protein